MPNGTNITNTYDVDGKRVQQSVDSQTTNYLWDELSPYGDVVLETDNSGSILASYTLAGAELISQTRSGATNYYLHDGQGSVRAMANASGNPTNAYAYTAFGEIYSQTGSTANNYLYTGQQFDSSSGLYNLRARYYDPGDGRFLSRDTIEYDIYNPIELNRYGYTANNPINFSDPSGNLLIENIILNSEKEKEAAPLQYFMVGDVSKEFYLGSLGISALPAGDFALLSAALPLPVRIILLAVFLTPVIGPLVCAECYVQPQVQSQSQSQVQAQPQTQTNPTPTVPQPTLQPRMISQCETTKLAIRNALRLVKSRYDDWIANRRGLRDAGHRKSYRQIQDKLRELLRTWDIKNCGPLPADIQDARDWANKPLP